MSLALGPLPRGRTERGESARRAKASTPARAARPGRCVNGREMTGESLVAGAHRDLVPTTVAVHAPLVDDRAARIGAGAHDGEAGGNAEAEVKAMMPAMGGRSRGKRRGNEGGDGGSRDDGLAEHVVWLLCLEGRLAVLDRQSIGAPAAFKIAPLNRVSSMTW